MNKHQYKNEVNENEELEKKNLKQAGLIPRVQYMQAKPKLTE